MEIAPPFFLMNMLYATASELIEMFFQYLIYLITPTLLKL